MIIRFYLLIVQTSKTILSPNPLTRLEFLDFCLINNFAWLKAWALQNVIKKEIKTKVLTDLGICIIEHFSVLLLI